MILSAMTEKAKKESPRFMKRLCPAPRGGGFRMEGYWVWCGAPIRGEDNR